MYAATINYTISSRGWTLERLTYSLTFRPLFTLRAHRLEVSCLVGTWCEPCIPLEFTFVTSCLMRISQLPTNPSTAADCLLDFHQYCR